MDAPHGCGYLSRVVDLPVAVAEALFDDATQSLGSLDHPDPTAIGTALLPARRVRTRLGSPLPGGGVPVEVELAPWSKSKTEVAVYKKRAPELLENVTDAITARLPGSRVRRRAA